MEETRVDRWLWAVRVYKTRSQANDACGAGHVTVNGVGAKPATKVRAGDRVVARAGGRDRDLEVVQVLDKRVGASVAAQAMTDHTPPPSEAESTPPPLQRDRGSGRPTKRDRRALDRFRRG